MLFSYSCSAHFMFIQDESYVFRLAFFFFFFFQAEDGIRDAQESRGLGDVYKRQVSTQSTGEIRTSMLGFWFSPALAVIASVAFPGYKTFLGLKEAAKEDVVDPLHEMLCYWLAFGLVITLEAIFGGFIAWIPLWHELKAGAMLFLAFAGAKTYILAHVAAPGSPAKSF
eukprot:TRINITY_DN151_c0_g1_i5.p2 TRINITY_DN151_c0_g1~~TRINITY_DN151_c0_g1_i5.p2  ORF type:complete len:169 (+),score=45.20 TRINITY_DN151_c0_g1_i5:48-554(+)